MLKGLFDVVELDSNENTDDVVMMASQRFVIKRLPIYNDTNFSNAANEVTINSLFGSYPFFSTLLGVDYTPDYISILLERSDQNLSLYAETTDQETKLKVFPKLTTDLLSALSLLHSAHIYHFDIKPENVVVDLNDGSPSFKLIDFGSASFVTDLFVQHPQTISTANYRAPELLVSTTVVSELFAADMWALGVTLYNFLAPDPFLDPEGDEDEFFEAIRRAAAPNISSDEFYSAVSDRAYNGRIETGVEMISELLTINPKKRPKASLLLGRPPLFRPKEYVRRAPRSVMDPLKISLRSVPTLVNVVAFEIATRYCGCVPDSEITSPLLVAKAVKLLAYTFYNFASPETDTEMVRPIMKHLGAVFNPGVVPVVNRAVKRNIDVLKVPLRMYEQPLRTWFT